MSDPNRPASAGQHGAQPPAPVDSPPYARQQPHAPQQARVGAYAPQATSYPMSAGQTSVAAPGRPGGTAKAALIVSIIGLVLGLANTVLMYALIPTNAYSMVALINASGSVIVLFTHLTAIVLALIALRGERRLMTGIALGVSGAAVISMVFTFLASTIATAI